MVKKHTHDTNIILDPHSSLTLVSIIELIKVSQITLSNEQKKVCTRKR